MKNCLLAFEMLSFPLNVGMPAASEIPAPVRVLDNDTLMYDVLDLPHTTTMWEDSNTDFLTDFATLSVSGSKGTDVISIVGARCGELHLQATLGSTVLGCLSN